MYVTSILQGHIEQNFPLGTVASSVVSPFKPRCGSLSFECSIWTTTFLFDRWAQHAPRWSSWPQRCSRNASCAEVCHLFPPPPAFVIFTAIRYFWMEGFWEKRTHALVVLSEPQTHSPWNSDNRDEILLFLRPLQFCFISCIHPVNDKKCVAFPALVSWTFLLGPSKWWHVLFPVLDSQK